MIPNAMGVIHKTPRITLMCIDEQDGIRCNTQAGLHGVVGVIRIKMSVVKPSLYIDR